MGFYIAICGILFTILGIIWSKSDWVNVLMKVAFFAMAVWSANLYIHLS